MKIICFVLMCGLWAAPVSAGGNHHHSPPPEPTPVNVPDDGSNHNALIIGVAIMAFVCAYHRCWKAKPVQDNEPTRITPELPNDRLIIRPKQ